MSKQVMNINLTEADLIHQKLDTIEAFYSSIKAKPTKKLYKYLLSKFLDSCGELIKGDNFKDRANDFVKMAKNNPERVSNILLGYLNRLNLRTQLDRKDNEYLNPSVVPNFFKPIKKLLEANEVPL